MSSIKERIAEFLRRKTGRADVYETVNTSQEEGDLTETVVFENGTKLTFWDVRDSEKAKEFEVEPGYYVEIHNVSEREVNNPDILYKYLLELNTLAWKKVPSPRKEPEGKIENQIYIDTNNTWIFNPYAYNPDKKALLIKAIKMSSSDNN